MATEKVTLMILTADLQCPSCYKKIRKTLCKFPQIRDQVYDEKKNEVKVTVVCCSPEKIRDKLCCKGGKSIKTIKIVELKPADKPKEPEMHKPAPKPEKPKEHPKGPEKPKGDDKPKAAGPPAEKPKGDDKPKAAGPPAEKPKGDDKPKAAAPPAEKPKEAPKPESAAMPPAAMQMLGPGPALVHGVPSVFPYSGPSHDAYPPGPYYHGYGFPPPSQPIYDGYYGHGHGHGHGCGYGYGYGGIAQHAHVNRDNYFSDENPQTCTIM
ncbi:pollen-specific leucine-rich repeat extensin-like protein 1 [Salvia miltiorrhiza]|uniref:pollen-specific leucine-rich repeat extensin-like protein 1 n=1 Tax=Salvia miltiorrhiza TaxID=226208 RepID=UPI0025AC7860|nr:pollen-specific leucine-rich repeat extensin-like protein 1 [Salvia miltiorrhiza]